VKYRFNPTTKIGITITDHPSARQPYFTLTNTANKKSLSFPYSNMMKKSFIEQGVVFLASCDIRVASTIFNEMGNCTFVISMNYFDKVHRLFSFSK